MTSTQTPPTADTAETDDAQSGRIVRVRWERTEQFELELPEAQVRHWLDLPADRELTEDDLDAAESGEFEDRLADYEYDPDGDDAFIACTERRVLERHILVRPTGK